MGAKGEYVKREAKEREFEDESTKHTVLFTAGTAVLMVGLKRVVMTMFLVEQWRLWVFFILNVVLLAIFFTSTYPISIGQNQESVDNAKGERRMKKKRNEECVYWSAEDHQVEACNRDKTLQREETNENEDFVDECDGDEIEPPTRLSKEELNERVEAFIATFRQQLVLDARKGREVQFFNRQQKRENRSFIKIPKSGRSYVL